MNINDGQKQEHQIEPHHIKSIYDGFSFELYKKFIHQIANNRKEKNEKSSKIATILNENINVMSLEQIRDATHRIERMAREERDDSSSDSDSNIEEQIGRNTPEILVDDSDSDTEYEVLLQESGNVIARPRSPIPRDGELPLSDFRIDRQSGISENADSDIAALEDVVDEYDNSPSPIVSDVLSDDEYELSFFNIEQIPRTHTTYKSTKLSVLSHPENKYLSSFPNITEPSHHLSLKWFNKNEELYTQHPSFNLNTTYEPLCCTYLLDNLLVKHRQIFETTYSEDIQIFNNYIQSISDITSVLFEIFDRHKVTFNLDKLVGYEICIDWILLTYIIVNDLDVKILETFFKATKFLTKPGSEYYLFRQGSFLMIRLCSIPRYLKVLLAEMKLIEVLKMIEKHDKILINRLLNDSDVGCYANLLTDDEEIVNFWLNFRAEHNMTIYHLICVYMPTHIIKELLITSDKFTVLKYVRDDLGFCAYNYLSNVTHGIDRYFSENIITFEDAFRSDANNMPIIHTSEFVLQYVIKNITPELFETYIDVIMNALVYHHVHLPFLFMELSKSESFQKLPVNYWTNLITKRVKLNNYDDSYPVYAYLAVTNELNSFINVAVPEELVEIKLLLEKNPYLLPYSIFVNESMPTFYFEDLASTLLDIGKWEYLAHFLKTYYIDSQIFNTKNQYSNARAVLDHNVSELIKQIITHKNLPIEFINADNNLLLFVEFYSICAQQQDTEYQELLKKYYNSDTITNVLEYIWNLTIKTEFYSMYRHISYNCLVIQDHRVELDVLIDYLSKKDNWYLTMLNYDPEIVLKILQHKNLDLTTDQLMGSKLVDSIGLYLQSEDIIGYGNILDLLIENHYLDNYIETHKEAVLDLLAHGDIAHTTVISKFPGFTIDYIYNVWPFDKSADTPEVKSQIERDVLKEILLQKLSNYFVCVLNTFEPPLEYKKRLIFDIEKYSDGIAVDQILYKLLEKGFYACEVFNDDIENYVANLCKILNKYTEIFDDYLHNIIFKSLICKTSDEIYYYKPLVKDIILKCKNYGNFLSEDEFSKVISLLLSDMDFLKKMLESDDTSTIEVQNINVSLKLAQLYTFVLQDSQYNEIFLTKIEGKTLLEIFFTKEPILFSAYFNNMTDLNFVFKHISIDTLMLILKYHQNVYSLLTALKQLDDIDDIIQMSIDDSDNSVIDLVFDNMNDITCPDDVVISCAAILLKLELDEFVNDENITRCSSSIKDKDVQLIAQYIRNHKEQLGDKVTQIYKNCPNIMIQNDEDIESYCECLTIDNIKNIIQNCDITSSTQDKILYALKKLNNMDKLIATLENMTIISNFVLIETDFIKEIIKTNTNIYYVILPHLINKLDEMAIEEALNKYIYLENEYNDYMYISYPKIKYCEIADKKFVDGLTYENFISCNKRKIPKIAQLLECSTLAKLLVNRQDVIDALNKESYISKLIFSTIIEKIVNDAAYNNINITDSIDQYPEIIKKCYDFTEKNLIACLIEQSFKFSMMRDLSILESSDVEINVQIEKLIDNVLTISKEEQEFYLLTEDKSGNNVLFNAILFKSNLFEKLADVYVTLFGQDILARTNGKNMTLLMYAYSVMNLEAVEFIINSDLFGFEQNYQSYSAGSALTHALMMCDNSEMIDDDYIDQINKLIKWKHFDKSTITFPTLKISIVSWIDNTTTSALTTTLASAIIIACLKSFEAFKILFTKFNNDQLLFSTTTIPIGKNIFDLFELAYLYSPIVFQYLLNKMDSLSKYSNIFSILDIDYELLVKMSSVQPYSWYLFIKHPSLLNTYLAKYNLTINDLYDAGLPYELNPADIDNMSHYIQATQEYSNDPVTKCHMCCIGKKKILFGCKQHMTCVGCSYRMATCPDCRAESYNDQKTKLFD